MEGSRPDRRGRSSYCNLAHLWFTRRRVNIWSPLYTAFYGTLMHITPDAYVVTILHRIPSPSSSLDSCWRSCADCCRPISRGWRQRGGWCSRSISNAAFTVHLFAVVPVLISWLLLLRIRGPWGRGTALGMLLATTDLVRNEYVVALVLLAALCGWWDLRRARRRARDIVVPCGAPLLIVALAAVLTSGPILLGMRRDRCPEQRLLGCLGMSTAVPVGVLIVVTQRPRPSYLSCKACS